MLVCGLASKRASSSGTGRAGQRARASECQGLEGVKSTLRACLAPVRRWSHGQALHCNKQIAVDDLASDRGGGPAVACGSVVLSKGYSIVSYNVSASGRAAWLAHAPYRRRSQRPSPRLHLHVQWLIQLELHQMRTLTSCRVVLRSMSPMHITCTSPCAHSACQRRTSKPLRPVLNAICHSVPVSVERERNMELSHHELHA